MSLQQQFETTRFQFMAQLNTLQNHLKDCADLADKYNQLLQQMPSGGLGANLPPIQFQPLAIAAAPTQGRKRKSKLNDDGTEVEDGRKRRKKKVREEGLPKRPPSAYLFYQNTVRSQLKEVHPFTPHHELLGLISKKWSAMSEEEKKPYEELQKAAKGIYETEMDVFNAAHGRPPRVKKEAAPATPITPVAVAVPAVAAVAAVPTDEASEEASGEGSEEEEEEEEEEEAEEEEEEEEEEPVPPPKPVKSTKPPSKVVETPKKKEKKSKAAA